MTFPNFVKCTHNFCMILHHEYVRRVYSSRFLSRHNNDSELWILKPLVRHSSRVWTNWVIALRQISVTAIFYLEDSKRIHPRRREESGGERAWGAVAGREREKEKEHTCTRGRKRERLAPPFICFLPPGPALCKLGSGRSAVLPEVLTQVLRPFFDLPLFYFRGLFPSLSCSHCHFGLLFPILFT